jgi:hypothetical protein
MTMYRLDHNLYHDQYRANQGVQDLNSLQIRTDCGWQPLDRRRATEFGAAPVEVLFDDIEQQCVDMISRYPFVVGCAAWFTSEPIAAALAKCEEGCQIVVQKEDFLRPDSESNSTFAARMREMYASLRCRHDRYHLGELVSSLSYCSDPTIEAVRCVGNHNSDRNPAFPRMHHKFLVFCNMGKRVIDGGGDRKYEVSYPIPAAVWTGSFNLTKNAGRSLENVVVIRSPQVADHYYQEWERIVALSEPLNWDTPWCMPEWRIGT